MADDTERGIILYVMTSAGCHPAESWLRNRFCRTHHCMWDEQRDYCSVVYEVYAKMCKPIMGLGIRQAAWSSHEVWVEKLGSLEPGTDAQEVTEDTQRIMDAGYKHEIDSLANFFVKRSIRQVLDVLEQAGTELLVAEISESLMNHLKEEEDKG